MYYWKCPQFIRDYRKFIEFDGSSRELMSALIGGFHPSAWSGHIIEEGSPVEKFVNLFVAEEATDMRVESILDLNVSKEKSMGAFSYVKAQLDITAPNSRVVCATLFSLGFAAMAAVVVGNTYYVLKAFYNTYLT